MTNRLPPAVVLGIDTPIGLAVIRNLGMHGVEVHGIGRGTKAIGSVSRYLHQSFVRPPGEAGLIQQLIELGNILEDACLFAISESDIELLNRHRPRLARFKMMFADEERMKRVVNKGQTYSAAEKIGIHVPKTLQIRSVAEAAAACKTIRFPLVLKWANPNNVMPALSSAGLVLDKAHYCYSTDELLAYLRRYEKVGLYPLIQEYCPGYGLGQIVLMHGGRAHYVFQHQRVHEWPPEGGFSSLCKSLPLEDHQSLMSKSIALLRELDWEGVAMVEYRYDPSTGNSALMEINGRFWGSLPLACHAGASFPWLMYKLIGMKQIVEQEAYRSGVRCRFMVPETKRLIRVLFGQKEIADKKIVFRRLPELITYLMDFIRPRTCYYVFAWSDPAPFARDIIQSVSKVISKRS